LGTELAGMKRVGDHRDPHSYKSYAMIQPIQGAALAFPVSSRSPQTQAGNVAEVGNRKHATEILPSPRVAFLGSLSAS